MPKQFNRYAAGRKVYGGGRSNPTSGTVDPTGYIDRSANNMASQRRSGLASSAISRRLNNPVQRVQNAAAIQSPAAPSTGVRLGLGGAQPGQFGGGSPTGQNYTPPAVSQPVGVSDSLREANPNSPALQINPQGRDPLTGVVGHYSPEMIQNNAANAEQQQAVNEWEKPIDPLEETRAAELEAERQRFLAELMGQETNFRSAAGRRIRELQQQMPQATERLTDDFASRGMGFSGRHTMDRGDLENRFAGMISGENEGLAGQLAQINAARGGKNSEIQALLNSNRAQAANRQAQDPRFRAPVVSTPRVGFGGANSAMDSQAIEAIKRRLLGG